MTRAATCAPLWLLRPVLLLADWLIERAWPEEES